MLPVLTMNAPRTAGPAAVTFVLCEVGCAYTFRGGFNTSFQTAGAIVPEGTITAGAGLGLSNVKDQTAGAIVGTLRGSVGGEALRGGVAGALHAGLEYFWVPSPWGYRVGVAAGSRFYPSTTIENYNVEILAHGAISRRIVGWGHNSVETLGVSFDWMVGVGIAGTFPTGAVFGLGLSLELDSVQHWHC